MDRRTHAGRSVGVATPASSRVRTAGKLLLFIALTVLGAAACATVSVSDGELAERFAREPAETGAVHEFASVARPSGEGPQSGVKLIARNDAALEWRLALIDSAEVSIEIQSFIWNRDFAGKLVFERLLAAADRGVQVRILIDDIFLTYPGRFIAALSSHENLEIRIFNPIPARRTTAGKALGFAANFRQMNRRMHNKLFIADGQVAIVGGRNIGNGYFGLSRDYNFRDLDVLTVGPELGVMRDSFDAYWNSRYAVPGGRLHGPGDDAGGDAGAYGNGGRDGDLSRARERLRDRVSGTPKKDAVVLLSMQPETLFAYGLTQMVPARVTHIHDHPYNRSDRSVSGALNEFFLRGHETLLLVTPYLVPDDEFLEVLALLHERGTEVQALVPSMASNNHTIVHSQYRKSRAELLERGVVLYEYKHQPGGTARGYVDWQSFQARFVSLHMKAVLAAGSGAFVGSFNLDPRALRINTENALIVESKQFAEQLANLLDPMLSPGQSWLVRRTNPGFVWQSADGEVGRQPARSLIQRFADALFRLLPLRGQL